MAESAFQVQYHQEFIASYEQRQSLVRQAVTTSAEIKGNQATFLVAGSGGATAVTRGLNGLIPGRADDLTQVTATLVEWHDKVIKTGFNIFASQGDQRQIMQQSTMAVINRKVDTDILTELANATQDTGAAQQGSLDLVIWAKTILGNNAVPTGNLFSLITPAFHAYLMKTKEFTSADYVNTKPFADGGDDEYEAFKWAGVNFIVHPNLTGKGTNAEKCYLFHRAAIGHAMDTAGIKNTVDVNREQDYSYALCSAYMGAKLMQNSGVVVMNHDGSAFAAQ